MALQGWDGFLDRVDFLVVFALIAGATLVVAARFENLRQHNFLLTLRARIASRELRMANRALRTLSESDPLTGIANRRGFEQAFEREILAPSTNGRPDDTIALMMIDLDHFKRFNDTHGHQAGDSCLQLVADALQEVFNKSGGIVGRYGGEEFIAALRHRDADAVRAIAEKARRTIADALTPAEGMKRSLITASIGVGMAPAAAMLPREELIEMADAALYTGKDSGRNRVEFVEAEAAFFKPN
jgi:diguanylate cyclase (GGDEF)-like protein